MMQIKNRIKEFRLVPAGDLMANDKNWRRHPQWQRDGMKAILENVGYAGALIAYESNGQLVLIDGHLRQEMTPTEEVPVLILDVNDEEADILLASYDPLTAMATEDGAALQQLLSTITSSNDGLNTLLQDINERYSASAIVQVENATNAEYLPNELISGNTRASGEQEVDSAGKPYKAFLVHFAEDTHAEVMEALFSLGDAWGLDTVAEVLLRCIRQVMATSRTSNEGE